MGNEMPKVLAKVSADFDKNMSLVNELLKPIDTPIMHVWAGEQYKILRKYIQEFENALDATHEVGIMLTNFGQSITMHVVNIDFEEPVLMVFRGYVNGQEATLIQHINQLNFLLTALPKEENRPKRKIGFSIDEKAKR